MSRPLIVFALLASVALASATTDLDRQPRGRRVQQPTRDYGSFCQGCKSIVSFAQSLNTTNERPDYKETITRFCEMYYPVSTDFQQGPCEIFVGGFFWVMDHVDPVEHCDQIGACGPSSVSDDEAQVTMMNKFSKLASDRNDEAKKQLTVGGKAVCEFCEQIVEGTRAALTDPKTVDTIRQQMDAFCDFLRVIDQDKQCHQLTHQYLDQALAFIRNIDPLQYCKSVQMCSAAPKQQQVDVESGFDADKPDQTPSESLSSLPTLSDFNNFGIETSVVIGERPAKAAAATAATTRYGRGPNCAICKTVVKEMFKFLRNNKTEANIIVGLNRICKLIYPRGPELDQCHSMVRAYTKELIELLIDETDPQIICTLLEQCTYVAMNETEQQKKKFELSDLMSALDPTIFKYSGRACFECRMFIDYMKHTIEDPKSQEYMRDWLNEHLCSDLPDKNLIDSCSKMVDEYSEVFFHAVAGKLNARSACIELGVCKPQSFHSLIVDNSQGLLQSPASVYRQKSTTTTTTNKPLEQSQRGLIKGKICDQCVSIVTQLDDYLSTHSIDKDVSVLIDQVCNKMPQGPVRTECVFVVKAFGSEIADWVANMDSPRQVCNRMALC